MKFRLKVKILETFNHIFQEEKIIYQQDVNILAVNNFSHPYLRHKGLKNIYILLVDDVTLTAYKVTSFNIRSPLMKTLDRSVEMLGRECKLCVMSSFI